MSASPVTPAPVRRSWIGAIGLNGRPKSVRLLTVIVVLAALVVAVLAPLISIANHPARPLPAAAGVVLAAGLAAAGQLGRLRFRLGRGTVSVSWSEAALIVGLALAPPGWMPAATLIGAAVAWALLGVLHDRRGIAEVANLAASLSLGSAAGAGVTVLAARNADWSTPRMQAALVGGAAVSLLVAFGLATVTLLAYRDAEVRQIVTRVPAVKIPMFAGNLLVGLGAVFALVHEPRWLLAFPVALWMLQRSYRFHLRAEEERRTWEAFAAATATLPARRIGDVVDAGLRGALDVFGASRAEVEVNGVDGPLRSAQDGPGRDDTANVLAGPAITRTMTVGGEVVGELTVWLAEPTLPAPRDESAISAYADALAAALHDAAAHEHVARLQRLVEDDTLHDRLTGLTNRSTLIGNGDRLLRSFDRERQVALLLLDINDFREVNGTLGHRSGDDVLRIVSQRMRELARENELVARTGDDEFALFIPQFTTLTDSAATRAAPNALPQAMRRAREIVERLSLPMHVTGVRLAVEVAVGVAVATAGRGDLAELVRRASLALDQAKRHEVAVATHDAGQDALTTDELALLAELQDALAADDQILMHLQPAVDLVTAGPTGVEALVRWRHPRRGQLSPGDFIRTVEHTELLTPFTRRVLDLALNAAAAWGAAGIDVPVSVNVAARSLLDREFPGEVADALRRHRLPASQLVLEITESVAVSEQAVVDEVLADLRRSGVQLSLDDFGTGYSSLSIVTRVPVDEIKIDRSFVDDMIDVPAAEAVVRGAVELGARLGVRVVAEGVETTEQREALIEMGCPSAQGYHFSKPLPADRIVAALTQLSEAAPTRLHSLRADDAS